MQQGRDRNSDTGENYGFVIREGDPNGADYHVQESSPRVADHHDRTNKGIQMYRNPSSARYNDQLSSGWAAEYLDPTADSTRMYGNPSNVPYNDQLGSTRMEEHHDPPDYSILMNSRSPDSNDKELLAPHLALSIQKWDTEGEDSHYQTYSTGMGFSQANSHVYGRSSNVNNKESVGSKVERSTPGVIHNSEPEYEYYPDTSTRSPRHLTSRPQSGRDLDVDPRPRSRRSATCDEMEQGESLVGNPQPTSNVNFARHARSHFHSQRGISKEPREIGNAPQYLHSQQGLIKEQSKEFFDDEDETEELIATSTGSSSEYSHKVSQPRSGSRKQFDKEQPTGSISLSKDPPTSQSIRGYIGSMIDPLVQSAPCFCLAIVLINLATIFLTLYFVGRGINKGLDELDDLADTDYQDTNALNYPSMAPQTIPSWTNNPWANNP